jgi:hypothetical protein
MRIATIHVSESGDSSGCQASARGQGRKDGTAACRALRNLLREQQFRRRKMISIHLDLVITNLHRTAKPRRGGSNPE